MAELIPFNLGGVLRFTAKACALVPTASGDGPLVARLLVATDDPSARTLAMALSRWWAGPPRVVWLDRWGEHRSGVV
jgi:hypothetical protein